MYKRCLCLFTLTLFLAAGALGLRLRGEQAALAARLIRLHVVAASDTPADQARKLRVRDAILPEVAALTAGCPDADAAEAALRAGLPRLLAAARTQAEGQALSLRLCEETFPRRVYDTFALPAGSYRTLRLTLGPGAGHNWWCVAFPALCLPAGADFPETARRAGFSQTEIDLMTARTEEVQVKFRLFDWVSALFTDS